MKDKYYYKVRAIRNINNEKKYSNYSKVYEFSSIPRKVGINDEEVYYGITNKNQTFLLINNSSENITFQVKRSDSEKGSYETVSSLECGYFKDMYEEEADENEDMEYVYICVDTGVTPGKTYYYNIKTIMKEGEEFFESKTSDSYSIKIVPAQVFDLAAEPYKYNATELSWIYYYVDGYEIYRATSKTGKYTKIGTTTDDYFASKGLTIGKTYYYKVRAYYLTESGEKVYGPFSYALSKKVVALTKLNTFPIELSSDTSTSVVNKVTFTKKSIVGSNVIYSAKIYYSKTWSAYKQNIYYTLYFYDYEGNYLTSYKIYHNSMQKGTKKNYSITKDIKVPNNAVYWQFE